MRHMNFECPALHALRQQYAPLSSTDFNTVREVTCRGSTCLGVFQLSTLICLLLYVIRLAGWLKHCKTFSLSQRPRQDGLIDDMSAANCKRHRNSRPLRMVLTAFLLLQISKIRCLRLPMSSRSQIQTGSQQWDDAAAYIPFVPSMAGQMPQEHM